MSAIGRKHSLLHNHVLTADALSFGAEQPLFHPRTATSSSWGSAVSGDWATAANWKTTVPDSSTDATIAVNAAAYAVTISSASQAHSLKLGASNATLYVNSSLSLGGTLAASAGTIVLSNTGTISSGTLATTGASYVFAGGVLNQDTIQGTLSVGSAANANYVTFTGGTVFTGPAGSGTGILNVGSSNYNSTITVYGALTGLGALNITNASVNLYGTRSLSNGTITLASTGTSLSYLDLLDDHGSGSTLTLSTTETVANTGGEYYYNYYLYEFYDELSIGSAANTLINAGTIVSTKGLLDIGQSSGTFLNTGSVTATGVNINISATNWSNTGTFTASSGGGFTLGGNFSTTGLGTINRSGASLIVTGTLTNTGATLSIGGTTALGQLDLSSGTIIGGVIADAGNGLTDTGTLTGVTYRGPLNETGGAILLKGNTTLANAAGTGKGTLIISGSKSSISIYDTLTGLGAANLTGTTDALNFYDSSTIDNATITLAGSDTLADYRNLEMTPTLTLGSGLVLSATNGGNSLSGNGGSLASQATLSVSAASASLDIGSGFANFSNAGKITATSGGTISIDATAWANTGSISETNSTLALGGSYSGATLKSIQRSGGTLSVAGTLNLGTGTLALGSGTALGGLLLNGVTVNGGTITDAGGGLGFAYNTSDTLAGVTYVGRGFDVNQQSTGVTFTGGASFSAPVGGSPVALTVSGYEASLHLNGTVSGLGTLNVTGRYANASINGSINGLAALNLSGDGNVLYVDGTQTLDNLTVQLGSNTQFYAGIYSAGTTLTLGAGATVVATGSDIIGTYGDFVSQGTVSVASNESLSINGSGIFANQGVISVGSAGTLAISSTGFSNTGTIVDNGATVSFGGTYALGDIGTLQRSGGTLTLGGTINNAGSTLNLDSSSTLGSVTLTGTINGGVVHDAGNGGASYQGATFNNVTFQGTLDLTANGSSYVYFTGNNSFTNASGTGTGTINATNATLYTSGITTLDNATIKIGSSSSGNYSLYLQNGALTLSTHITILQSAQYVEIYDYGYSLTNLGNIFATTTNGTFGINVNGFTNTGSITVSNGDIFALADYNVLSNFSSTTLGGGSYEVDANSTFSLGYQQGNSTTLTTLAAKLTLSGANSAFLTYDSNTGSADIAIDTTLHTVTSTGSLYLLAGRSFSTTFFNDNGTLGLGGGTFTSTNLTLGAGASVSGFGTIAGPIAGKGTVNAHGGTLAVTGNVTGTSSLTVDNGATLDLSGSTTAANTISFTGAGATLILEKAASNASTIANLQVGDTLGIGTLTATSATLTANALTIGLSGGGTLTETLANPGAIGRLAISADGHSITAFRLAQPGAVSPASLSFGKHHVGDTVTATLSVTNTAAADGYSERLDAGLTASAGLIASGGITDLAAGATDSTDLTLTLNTASTGSISAAGTIAFASDGAMTSGLPALALGTQTVAATGAVYAYAAATLANGGTVTLGNTHVGQAVTGRLGITNSATANGFAEALNATLVGGSNGFSVSGHVADLVAGATNTASLSVSTTATKAGRYTGNATLNLASDGTNLDGLGVTTLANQGVAITGLAYNYAAASVPVTTISLGIIHAGTAATQAISIGNTAPGGSFTEALDASWSTATAGVTLSGSLTGLAAGAVDTASLLAGVNTTSTGSFTGTALLSLVSDGAGVDGLGMTLLGTQTVTVTATVDNYALAAFEDAGGPAIAGSGTSYTVDLGSALQGGAALTLSLGALNAASGLADLLSGSISTAGAAGFTNSGFGSFSGLGAGQGESSQSVTLSTGTAGVFTETVLLSGTGSNGSGYSGALATETLTITGTIYSPGSPAGTYTLSAGANTLVGQAGGDVFIASAASINSRDSITGGSGSNTLQLTGAGTFDLGAPKALANIQTVTATEGQAAGKTPDTRQTIYLRDGLNETLTVANGKAASGNTNPETITIYSDAATNVISLGTGSDNLVLDTGADTVTLGSAKNSVSAGGGTALVKATAAAAAAAVVGVAAGSTTLEITSAGTVILAASDTYLTVKLDAASSKLTLGKLGFITADGSAGHETVVAGAANQTLIGGTADILTGTTGGSDSFVGGSSALNGDTIGNWATGDLIDLTDVNSATLQPLAYKVSGGKGTLTVTDGTHTSAIFFSNKALAIGNFTVVGSDGHSGSLIGFHS